MDPLWNLYFLALVLSIAENVEAARLPTSSKRVFSYRYRWNAETADVFDDRYGWRDFMECSLEHAKQSKFVVVCDIAEFYPRLGHHRLENALLQLGAAGDAHARIMSFLFLHARLRVRLSTRHSLRPLFIEGRCFGRTRVNPAAGMLRCGCLTSEGSPRLPSPLPLWERVPEMRSIEGG
jgi:hypothetical protein